MSKFCAAPALTCTEAAPDDPFEPQTWLEITYWRPGPDNRTPEQRMEEALKKQLFEIEFDGRRTRYSGDFGRRGVFDHEIVVDRIIKMREVPLAEQ